MFKLFVCVSILIAVVGADYDFHDSDFNELIFDDLTAEAEDDFLEPLRFRRSSDNATEHKVCHRRRGSQEKETHCCSGEKANSQERDAIREIKKNCIAEVRGESDEASYDPLNCDRVQSLRQQMICTSECIAKKFDLLDESGELKRDALLAHTRKAIGESTWKAAVVEEYVDKCLAELKVPKDLKRNKACNPHPLEFRHCIWREFVQGCPAESKVDSKKCRKMRERFANGDTSYSDKSFKRHFRPRH